MSELFRENVPEKNDNTIAEQIAMYLLIILNGLLIGIAILNIFHILKKNDRAENKKLLFLNSLALLVVITRISYEIDAIPRAFGSEGYPKQIYVFLGVASALLFNILMMFCSYFWYNIVILITLHLDAPPIRLSQAWFILIAMIILNVGCLIFTIIKELIEWNSENTIIPLLTSCTSIIDGILFSISAFLLYQFVVKHTQAENSTRNLIKQATFIGKCAAFRCIVDVTFYFPFSRDWKTASEKENGIFWALFIFIYFIISDIIPMFLFLRVFSAEHSNAHNQRESSRMLNESLIHHYIARGQGDEQFQGEIPNYNISSRVAAEQNTCKVIYDHNALLSHEGTIPGKDLQKLKVVVLLFAAQWCPPCREFCSKLSELYAEKNSNSNKQLEVVFISGDYDEKAFHEYFSQMPWLALPYEDPAREVIIDELDIGAIPEVFIITRNNVVVTRQGRTDVETLGMKAFDKWVHLSN